MPTYEYQCKECGSVFDVFQSIKAAPLRKADCENCGATRPVRRLIGTGGAVLFKGSGFYQTDYRSDSYKKAVEGESPKKGASTGPKEGKDLAGKSKAADSSSSAPIKKAKNGAKDSSAGPE